MLHCTLMKMAERRCDVGALSSFFCGWSYFRVLHTDLLFSPWHCRGECLHRTTTSETQQQMQIHDRNKQENYNLANRWNKIIEQYGPREKMTGDVSHDKSLFLVLDRLVNQESKSNIAKIQSASRCYLPKAKYEKNMTFFETLEALHSEGVIGNGNYDILIKILMKADCLSDDIMLEIGETTRKIKCIETTKRHAFSSSESLCSRSSGAFFPFHWTAVEYLLDALLIPSVVIQENISIETTKKHAFNFSTSLCSENWWVSSGPSFASFPSKLTVYQDEVYHQHDALFPVLARLVDQENKSIEKILTASRCYLTKANYKKNMTFLETLIALESEGVIGIGNYEILIRILGKAGCLSDDIMLAIEETTQKNKCREISIRASFPFSVNHVLKLDHVLLKKDKVLEILGSSKMLISNIISFNGFNELQNQRICRDTEVVPQYFIMNGQTRTEKMEESVFLGVTASEPRESSSWKTPRFSERASHNKIGQQIFGISIAFYSEEAGETSDRNIKPATRSGQGNLWMKFSLFMLILLGTSVGGSCLPASCPGEILKANVSRDVLIWVNDSKPIRIERFYLNHLTPLEKETCLSDPVVTEGVERAVVMYLLAVFLQWQIWQHLFCVSFQGLPRTSGKSSRLLMIRVFLCLTVNGSAAESVPKGVGLDDCEFCHQICQPNIMKMNCDKYCSNLCGNERFSAEVFNTEPGRDTLHDIVKWFGIVSAVMVIILLLHLFVFSEVSNHLNQGCHDMPGPESVVKCNHFLMYSKRCLFSVLMEGIEKSNLDSKTHNDSVDNGSKEVGDVHSSLKHNNTSEQQREVTLCTSEREDLEQPVNLSKKLVSCFKMTSEAEEANSNSASVLSSTEKEESPDVLDVFDSETERSERKSYDIDSETDDTNATNKNKQITDLTPCNTPKQERVSDKTWDDQNYWDAQNSESLESVSDSDDSARITDRGNSKDVSYDQDVICGTDLSGSTNSSEGTQESADTGNSPVQCTTAEQQTETKSVNKQPEVELNTIDTDDENVFPVTTYNSSAKDLQQDLQHLMQRLRDAEATIQRAPVLPAVCHKNENMLVKLGFHIVHASCSCVVFTKPTEREELQHINSTFRLMGECTEIFENNRNFKLQRKQDPCLDWLWHVCRRNYHTKVPQMQKIHGSYHRANSSRVKEDVKRDRTISDRRICDRSSIKGSQKTNFKSNLFKMTDIEEQMINTNEETHEMNWQCPTQRLYNIPSLPITNSPDRTTADSVVKKGQEDDDDDCDILRNITWLPLEDLPVPQIHTDIIVNSAAQVILDRIAKGETVGAQESMKFEVLRVCTYRNYPGDNKPFRLLFASAGWYYASDNDEVVCYRCGVRKSNWNEADNPSEIHTKMRPGCDFLVKNSEVNIPIPELESSKLIKFKKLDELLDSRVQIPVEQLISSGSHGNLDLNSSTSPRFRFFTPPPKHPQYALQAVRLDSFRGWPTNIPQTAATMAECGYYYAGFGDCVRCFHCGIGLRHWTDEDNPWIEHARWSKDCVYLRQMKGEEFIQNVYLAIQEEEEREDVEPETQSGQAGNISQIAPSDDSSQILLTDPAQSVLEMGYQPKIIKKAIDVILHNEGRSGITAMKIMEQIFRFEENSELEQGVANMNNASGSEVQSQNSPRTGQTQNKGNGSKEPNSSTGTKAQSQSVTGQSQENKETGHSGNSPKNQGQKKDTNKKAGDTVQTQSKLPSATGKQEKAAASAKPSPQSSLDENVNGAIAENSKNDTTKIKAENRKLKEQTICKVCLDKAVSFVFLPCGHLVTCAECAPAMKKCPICRGLVKGSVKAFMS